MEFTHKDLNKTLWVKQTDQEKNRLRYKVDATGKTLGRLAVDVAKKLSGKDKSYYSDFRDAGSFVIVENADKITVSGKKLTEKVYYSYSGYKGNLKSITLGELLKKNPCQALRYAVRGMLPKNKLRDLRMKRLKIEKATTTKYDHFTPLPLYK
ncbi:MAG: 50S ribosomal protein L13 [Candidatus Peribacteria bacterium]|jgi:large subunit ribosomal protein L13|nr:50S ribosomal protein L13 [Candidatus Peribacteria bacterium]